MTDRLLSREEIAAQRRALDDLWADETVRDDTLRDVSVHEMVRLLDTALAAIDRVDSAIRDLQAAGDALATGLVAVEALQRYGRHADDCKRRQWVLADRFAMRLSDDPPDCSCGLDDLLRRLGVER